MVHGQRGDFGQDGPARTATAGRAPEAPRRGADGCRCRLADRGRAGRRRARGMVGLGQLTGGQAASHAASALSRRRCRWRVAEQAGPSPGSRPTTCCAGLPNCSYPSPPSNGLFVALSPSEYDGAAACGGYLTVTGPDGSVTVQVIDQCPECASRAHRPQRGGLRRARAAGRRADQRHYQYLADPPLPGPITMEVKSGSSQYWLALLADNTGNPLASVQVETASGGWVSLARANYNYWIAQSGAGSGPFTVRLTDTEGHTVTVHNVALDPGAVQSTGVYMYGAGSDPAPPTARHRIGRADPAPPPPRPPRRRASRAATALASPTARPRRAAATGASACGAAAAPRATTATPAADRRPPAPAVASHTLRAAFTALLRLARPRVTSGCSGSLVYGSRGGGHAGVSADQRVLARADTRRRCARPRSGRFSATPPPALPTRSR